MIPIPIKRISLRRRSLRPVLWLGLGLGLLFVALSPGRVIAFDVGIRAATAHQLWRHLTPFIPAGGLFDPGLIPTARGGVSFYGIGQSLLFVPFDFLGTVAARLVSFFGASSAAGALVATLPLVFLYAPLAGLAWWLGTARLLRELGLARATAHRAAAVFAVTTIALVYSAQTLQEESAVGAFFAFGLAYWLRALRTGRGAFLAGVLAASAIVIRLNAGIAGLIFLGAAIDAWKRHRIFPARTLALGVAGTLLPFGVLGFFAWARFGSPFSTGYDLAAAHGLGVAWTAVRPWLAAAFLLGLGKGLWLYSPALWLAVPGLRRAAGFRPGLWTGVLLAWIVSCLLHSKIVFNPDGSECWGIRYGVHLLTPLAYPMALALSAWRRRGRATRAAAYGLVSASVALQALAFLAPDAVEYNQADIQARPRYELIYGVENGQLARRLANLRVWAAGSSALTVGTDTRAPAAISLARLETAYVPNLWPSVYAKRTSSLFLRALLLSLGLACAAGAAWGLRAGFRPLRPKKVL